MTRSATSPTLTLGSALVAVVAGISSLAAQSTPRNGDYEPFLSAMTYRMVGPSRGGRVTAVAGHRAHPSTFYMGATGGGVWKTRDYGRSWHNISDGFFGTGSIGAIRVADSDTSIIYVGTGSDGIRSNVVRGVGMYRSTDAGETWSFAGLPHAGQVGAVLIHPTDPDLVYAAALGSPFGPGPDRGVYRSDDGGVTWQHVLFVSDSTGAVDLEFAPDNPREIYASMWRAERKPWTIISGAREGGIYKSSDAGETWTRLTDGLPSDLVGKSDLAVSAADPDRVYVLIEAAPGRGLYRSDDRGASFHLVSDDQRLIRRPFYYTNVDADPQNPDLVYVNNEAFLVSSDGGETFDRQSTPHGDNHDMWINPDNPRLFVQSNDGGANVTLDGGTTWSTQRNQPTAELYQVNVDDRFPYWLYAGQQDHAPDIAVPSLPPYSAPGGPTAYWEAVGGCETGPVVPQPGNANIVFSNCKGRFGRYNRATGQEQQYYVGAQSIYGHNPRDLIYRFQRVSPIAVSPHDPNTVYHASQFLHVTRDGGATWETISPDLTAFEPDKQVVSGTPITRDITGEEYYSTIYAVAESPLEPGLIWVGANDGPVHVTRDGGQTWTDVTPADLPPNGRVQTVEPSPHAAGKAYVVLYRYLLDDFAPYIYRTTDYGASWTRLTTGRNGIPGDNPTRVVREDPDREGLLYAGTEHGMYVSFDDGMHWQSFQQNLPDVPVTDVKVHRSDLVLSTMGRSFWILDDLTPLHELDDRVGAAGTHLFQPRDAYRMRYRAGRDSIGGPHYPAPGATIVYYLAVEPQGELTLEILNGAGEVVRAFSSEEREEGKEREIDLTLAGRPGAMVGVGTEPLDTDAGMHRFRWDLRYPGSWRDSAGGRNGPLAVPGTYRALLTAGDWSAERSFRILIDPRVEAAGVTHGHLGIQLSLSLQVRDAISAARIAVAIIHRMRDELPETGGRRERLDGLERALVDDPDIRYPQRMLIDQLTYLYGMISRADQRPGRDAYQRFETLREELARLMDRLRGLGNVE